MTQLITNDDTGTRHVVNSEIERKSWQQDVAHCGETGHGREPTNNWAAAQAADNLCETCRKRAAKDALMAVYEAASEYEAEA